MKVPLALLLVVLRGLLAVGALAAIVQGCYLLHPALAYIVGGALVWFELRSTPGQGGGGPAS